jgi:CHAT domain-containing protein
VEPLPLEPTNNIPPLEIDTGIEQIEQSFSQEYEQYFGQSSDTPSKTLAQARNILSEIEATTNVKAAFIYVSFVPASLASQSVADNKSDELELLLVTSEGRAIRKRIAGSTRSQVIRVVRDFQSKVTSSRSTNYLNSAKQLYRWLVTPLEADLQAADIQNLVFIMDKNLRSIPLAALHSGQEFLVEKYSISLMPSLTLTDSQHRDIRGYQVLAMGASQFTEQNPLPAVPLELSVITQQLWQGKSFLNEDFTLENLKLQRQLQPFQIVHLATHGEFQPGAPANSYLQLWDTKLRLSQLPQLNWSNPPVDLLVLSACRTALGNEQAELGFAGLALQAGVKSALASLWYVSDEATLGLMSEFYQQLRTAPIKAEALRQTQIAMLRGQVRLENGQLVGTSRGIPLPEALSNLGDKQLRHPYYWAAFTLIGNPW